MATATKSEIIDRFTTKAETVSATVKHVASMDEAIEYATDICVNKDACDLLVSGCRSPLSIPATELCETKGEKIVAAPALDQKTFEALQKKGEANGFAVVPGDYRKRWAGMDVGFTIADGAIAETGSVCLESSREDVRLATMISEIHVAVVPISKLVETYEDFAPTMLEAMQNPPNYYAFITGASRTADIERVLAIGVHGPLELHILLLED